MTDGDMVEVVTPNLQQPSPIVGGEAPVAKATQPDDPFEF